LGRYPLSERRDGISRSENLWPTQNTESKTALPAAPPPPALPRIHLALRGYNAAAKQRTAQGRGAWRLRALPPDAAPCNSKPRYTAPFPHAPARQMHEASPLRAF